MASNNYLTKSQIARKLNLGIKTFQRWSKAIDLNLDRGFIPEECFPEIEEKIHKYAMDKIKKRPPDSASDAAV